MPGTFGDANTARLQALMKACEDPAPEAAPAEPTAVAAPAVAPAVAGHAVVPATVAAVAPATPPHA